ncbi:hypothetical protein VPHK567_0123 [Vibrio phage K567]
MIEFKRVNMGSNQYPLYVYDSIDECASEDVLDTLTDTNFKDRLTGKRFHKFRVAKTHIESGWCIRVSDPENFCKFIITDTGFKTKKAAISYINLWYVNVREA